MDKLKKIQADILQGHKDSNIKFSDLQKLLAAIGGKERWLRRTKLGKLGSLYLKIIC